MMLVRKASFLWKKYDADVKNAWREWAKRLNGVPVSDMLEMCPQMFQSFNEGLEGAIVKLLFHDWNHLYHSIQKTILERYYDQRKRKVIKFGGDDVELCKMVYRNSIQIPFLLSCFLFGESFEKVAKLTVKKTVKSILINIWSNERSLSLFSIQNLNAFCFWKKDL